MAYLYVLSGPAKGRSFRLREGDNYIGRSIDNDIRIEDRTLSRKHARIVLKKSRFFITDLKSQNKTFFDSAYLEPGIEVELKAGVPIALGTTIVSVSLSETDDGQMTSFSETVKLSRADIEKASALVEGRDETEEKRLQLLQDASNLLISGISIREALERILESITEELNRVDRAAILLTDLETGEVEETVLGPSTPKSQKTAPYSTKVVERVLAVKRPVMISNTKTEEGDIADTLKVLKVQCVLCAPMIFASRLAGVIYLDSVRRPYGFREDDLAFLMELGQQIALALEKARFVSDISRAAESLVPDED
ncbi:MAG: GAF domain-containing protein [Desulfobacterota bacterium]|jgi:pSer/pThr/pTyr-binding forkhead associated (FHA) protein|nr:GAF domain-containing protein [Thermodesulfobacteriota bacterium]